MVKLLEILGMQNEYEGCSIEQIANFVIDIRLHIM